MFRRLTYFVGWRLPLAMLMRRKIAQFRNRLSSRSKLTIHTSCLSVTHRDRAVSPVTTAATAAQEASMKLIDIGANLLDLQYSGFYNDKQYHTPDLNSVLNRAWANGEGRCTTPRIHRVALVLVVLVASQGRCALFRVFGLIPRMHGFGYAQGTHGAGLNSHFRIHMHHSTISSCMHHAGNMVVTYSYVCSFPQAWPGLSSQLAA